MNKERLKILIVIPTYNNRATLSDIVGSALEKSFPVLVVNDGSTDGAMETLAGHDNLFTIGWKQNRGKGIALIKAALWATENGYTHIITVDADGQHDPADIHKFVTALESNPHSIILGHRNFQDENVPFSSRFGRKFSNFWVWMCTGLQLKDTQSGYRAYPLLLFNQINFKADRYDFEVEALVKGVWAGLDVNSADVSVSYSEETINASHFRSVIDNARISWTYTQLVIRNFLPVPHKILFKTEAAGEKKLSVKQPKKSLKLLFTEATSPREITIACMLGIFLGTLPLIAMHSITIVFAATRLRLNRLIALNISHFCAPPFVPVIAFEIGYFLLHGEFFYAVSFQAVFKEVHLRFFEYLLGAIVCAPVFALITGFLIYILSRVWFRYKAEKKQITP
ncbi:MAG: DUF2062 domain-containing protein [Desulfobacterales bacterium]|nr:DUF2062 domain-containing protein [Desulfobacterales bacterium]